MKPEFFQDKVRRYQKFMDVSLYLGSTLDFPEVIKRIITICKEILYAEAASIILYDDKKEELSFYQSVIEEEKEHLKKIILKKGEGIAGYVAHTREKLIVNDAENDPRHDKRADKATGKKTRNLIAIPVIFQNRFIGVMEVINKIDGDFTEDDLNEAELLANIAGVSLENSKLHEVMKDNYKKIKSLEESKTKFISLMSHELYTPLTSINGYTDLLLKRYRDLDTETVTDSLRVIKSLSGHFYVLINDLFIVNEVEDIKKNIRPVVINIKNIINEKIYYWNDVKASHNVTFKVEDGIDEEKFKIKADPDKTGHCLYHLLDNATKFSPVGSNVEVELSFLSVEGKDIMEIAVKDEGPGIEKEYHEKIFEKFYQISSGFGRTHEGMGIGLFVCKKIIEAHGGSIFCESEPGNGSRFYIRLPR